MARYYSRPIPAGAPDCFDSGAPDIETVQIAPVFTSWYWRRIGDPITRVVGPFESEADALDDARAEATR